MSQHITIIGGGIIGLSTAYALILRAPKTRVTVLESGREAGRGASWANGSMIHPSQATPWLESGACVTLKDRGGKKSREGTSQSLSEASYSIADRSARILRSQFKHFGLQPRHISQGTVKIYPDRASMDADMQNLLALMKLGLRTQIWSAQQTRNRFDGLSGPLAGAVYFPDDFSGPARLYCQALISHLLAAGVSLKTGRAVTRIDSDCLVLASGEHFTSDVSVICAGAASAHLAPQLAVIPVFGYSRTYDLPAALLPRQPIMDDSAHLSITPLGDHLRVSGGADRTFVEGRPDQLEAKLLARFPRLKPSLIHAPRRDWYAARPMRARGAFMGKISEGLYANTGHGHMGWTQCAGAAQFMSELILG